jgi:hypothetical protein
MYARRDSIDLLASSKRTNRLRAICQRVYYSSRAFDHAETVFRQQQPSFEGSTEWERIIKK